MNEHQEKQLQRAIEYAKSKGGECLSSEFQNIKLKMIWKCANSAHKAWQTSFEKAINRKQWCPTCNNESKSHNYALKNGLDKAKEIAISKGGQCLSAEYKNAFSSMLWKCANPEHKPWSANFNRVRSKGSWCPQCADAANSIRLKNQDGFTQAKEHAQLRGGECLSTEYINNRVKMLWKCNQVAHKPWKATYADVVSIQHWCPECRKRNPSEKRTRLIFEEFFGKPFPSVKPAWNINPWTYRKLELDGYCEDFKVAFEYDGEHHTRLVKYNGIKRKLNDLTYQKFKDHQKKKNCLMNGITLINIPFITDRHRNKFHPFLANVIMACKERGFDMLFTPDQLTDLEKKFYAV